MANKNSVDMPRKPKAKPRGKPFEPGNQFGQKAGEQSRNPAGRPPSKKYLSEAYREWLSLPDEDDPTLSNADVVAAKVGAAAKKGNISAASEISDRTEGRPRQAIELDTSGLDWRDQARQLGLSIED